MGIVLSIGISLNKISIFLKRPSEFENIETHCLLWYVTDDQLLSDDRFTWLTSHSLETSLCLFLAETSPSHYIKINVCYGKRIMINDSYL